ncbi:uncharacterized protein BYT42DRAFT_208257 [Radiomyces spectabilis]|uniref:uncharacterized protein n=1 Tax=Radiomyces spectabilis TaxID=64574 RepID=UPI00221F3ED6|nr:uncharacterized protein BYT42DRAFT_208257 [Radiomyces spectabilis]KAI8391779.1 hypothetical protein BYT42DRAFT_208257 [Radiomyces spectabilis]
MYIFGGQRGNHYFNDLYAFNTSTCKSVARTTKITTVKYSSIELLSFGPFRTFVDPANARWECLSSGNEGPTGRSGHASVIYDNKFYIFGGTDGNHLYNDIWSYDLQARTWSQVAAAGYIPMPRERCAASLVDDVMYVIGGRGPDAQDLGDLCAFKIRNQRWYMFQNMGPAPSARHGLTITGIKEKMVVLGGDAGNGKMEDASMVYVLDSAKIKYPAEAPTQQNPPLNSSPSFSPPHCYVDADNQAHSPHYMQQIQQVQQIRGMSPSQSSQPTPKRSPQLQHQRQPSPVKQDAKDADLVSPIDPQASLSTPLPSTTNSSNARVKLSHPDPHVNPSTPPARPPRLGSMVPPAALRRPRTTSPLPMADIDVNVDHRRQPASVSTASPTSPGAGADLYPQTRAPQRPEENSYADYAAMRQEMTSPKPSQSRNTVGPPPRPSREGVNLASSYRHTMSYSNESLNGEPTETSENSAPLYDMPPTHHALPHQPQPPFQDSNEHALERSLSPTHNSAYAVASIHAANLHQQPYPSSTHIKGSVDSAQEERAALLREIKTRDLIISEMRKKEQWWRTEVSLARKQRLERGESVEDSPEADNAMLLDTNDMEPDKVRLLEQLIAVKAELRRVRTSIHQQGQPMSEKVNQADRMRTAALQEAAYFKCKYLAVKNRHPEELVAAETERAESLEKKLAAALVENESNGRLLQQLQKRAQHDHAARISAEERAKEAHERAEEAQEAHQRALEELSNLLARATRAEAQVRDGAAKIAELSNQLTQALSVSSSSEELSKNHIKVSQLEAANLKSRNEAAMLKRQLAESLDDIARLRTLLNEREESLNEVNRHLEDSEIQLGMMKEAMSQKGFTTRAY